MWRTVVRRASYIGAASWLLEAAQLSAFADVHSAPTTRSRSPAQLEAATTGDAPGVTTSATSGASTPKGVHATAVGQSHTEKHQTHLQTAPAALQEGTHFAVLSGADCSASRLAAVARAMQAADVVLLGEYHDDAVAHALQLALLRHVAGILGYPCASVQQGKPQQSEPQPQQPLRPLILSLEMFETDTQYVVSEYASGLIPLADLLKDARPWSNYMHDYHHLVEVCKQLNLPVVAANAPRRYVSLAGRFGSKALLQLPDAAKLYLPPLPHAPSSPEYVAKVQRSMQQAAASMEAQKQQQQQHEDKQQHGDAADLQLLPHATETAEPKSDSKGCPYIGLTVTSNFLAAQSLWDATMAHSISRALHMHQQGTTSSRVCTAAQQHSASTSAVDASQPQQPTSYTAAALDCHSAPSASSSEPDSGDPSVCSASDAGSTVSRSHSDAVASDALRPLVVHVCGKFHCEGRLGIPEHLAQYAPEAKVLVVVFTPHESMSLTEEEAKEAGLVGAADFVVLTDSRLPRSFDVEHPV